MRVSGTWPPTPSPRPRSLSNNTYLDISNNTNNGNKNLPLRSTHWFGLQDQDGFIHRSWMKNQGFPSNLFDGRPVIGICNTWSELVPCNAHFRKIADRVNRGIFEAGGFPVGVSRDVLGRDESSAHRHALPQPGEHGRGRIDPRQSYRWSRTALRMRQNHAVAAHGAASCDLPALVVSGGAMLNGNFRGQPIGSGTSVWR